VLRFSLGLMDKLRLCHFQSGGHLRFWGTRAIRNIDTERFSENIRDPVFDSVGMRCYRHAHVLQFPDDFRIVPIQLTG
jgi:hypothetical protein